jgi:hypothetical protein
VFTTRELRGLLWPDAQNQRNLKIYRKAMAGEEEKQLLEVEICEKDILSLRCHAKA